MKKNGPGQERSRLRSSYISLVVSVSLVLFLLGILGLVLINAKELSDYFRESLSFSVMLDDAAKEADIRMLQKDLDAKSYVKSTTYVSKDDAASKMKTELGEDFISFLGDNPLPPSIDVYLTSKYTRPDSVAKIEKYILGYPFVKEVYYQESLLFLINENVKKINMWICNSCFYFSDRAYDHQQYYQNINLFKKIHYKNNAACRSNKVVYQETIHSSKRIVWFYCSINCTYPFNGVAIPY